MNDYKIIGMASPNKVKLASSMTKKIIELPIRFARKMVDQGLIHIENPDSLYTRI